MGWLRWLSERPLAPYRCWQFSRRFVWCVRVNVKRGKWEGKAHPSDVEIADAADADLEPRPVDGGELSVYAATTDAEAERAALLHRVTLGSPAATWVLYVPASCLRGLWLDVVHRPDPKHHPLLQKCHFHIVGLTDEAKRHAFARAIFASAYRIGGWTKGDVKKLGRAIKESPADGPYMLEPDAW